MRNRNVYGKRPTAEQRLAAQIFGASSTPMKPNEPTIHDSPARNTRAAVQKLREEEQSFIHLADSTHVDVDGVVLGLGELKLGSCNVSAIEFETPTSKKTDSILQERSINRGVKRALPRRSRKLKPERVEPLVSPPLTQSNPREATHIKFDEEGQVLNKTELRRATHTRFDEDGQVSSVSQPVPDIDPPRRLPDRSRPSRNLKPIATKSNEDYAHLTEYAQPLLSLCSDPEGKSQVSCFQAWSDSVAKYLEINKIAEASYGEVYRLSVPAGNKTLGKADESVLKLIALKPPPTSTRPTPRNAKRQAAMSDIQDVTNEVRVLRHMSPVPGFTNFRDVRVLRGRLPSQFVTAWRRYNQDGRQSLFPDPGLKASYGPNQLWAVVEMQDAGTDVETLLERGLEVGAFGAWDVFWGVAGAVAKGEEWAAFEHRDLHMGNICVRPASILCSGRNRPTTDALDNFLNPPHISLDTSRSLNYTRIETTLIDYTLSRAEISSSSLEDTQSPSIAFFDLSKDPCIFAGDAAEEYQYEVYRLMRAAVLHGDPAVHAPPIAPKTTSKKARGKMAPVLSDETEAWRNGHRLTNLVWLHYVLHKLLGAVDAAAVQEKEGEKQVTELERKEGEDVAQLERELRSRLEKVKKVLAVERLGKGALRSAGDLVLWAMGKGWLKEEDVLGDGGEEGDSTVA